MDANEKDSKNFAVQLSKSLSSTTSSESKSAFADSNSTMSTEKTDVPSGMTSLSNPFFKGNLSTTDQERLAQALNRQS